MKIAFVLYDGMTALDFVGAYDPISRLKTLKLLDDIEIDVCAMTEFITDSTGLVLKAGKLAPSLAAYDMIVVAGGPGSRKMMQDEAFLNWVRTAAPCKVKAASCTGSLILGAAGFLKGHIAGTRRDAQDLLAQYCPVADDRVVVSGDVITSRGCATALELGLHLCEMLVGSKAKGLICEKMDFQLD
ncbi:MAG: DJ-1/PfpI family protein [Negativicutes bacterium]|nr:DJ-1/PfpI family protein [Negativicutes bacterium]